MSEENDDKSPIVKLPPELHRELQREIGARLVGGERVTCGALLLEAWRYYAAAKEVRGQAAAKEILNEVEKEISSDLKEIVEEFIRFATNPRIDDRIWSRHTLELLRERIAERNQAANK